MLPIKVKPVYVNGYGIVTAEPATGVLYITKGSPDFISGHLRLRGRDEGRYPYQYLEMIDNIFGVETNTIEVCSRTVTGCTTVDINPATNAEIVDDGQVLGRVFSNHYDRWRCDPPYNAETSKEMYNTELPATSKLLTAGARVCKPGALMFLLLGPQNFQWTPKDITRIGWIAITVVPNQELRALHIYLKGDETQTRLTSFEDDKGKDKNTQMGFSSVA